MERNSLLFQVNRLKSRPAPLEEQFYWKKLLNERGNLAKQLTAERANSSKLIEESKLEKAMLEESLKSLHTQLSQVGYRKLLLITCVLFLKILFCWVSLL